MMTVNTLVSKGEGQGRKTRLKTSLYTQFYDEIVEEAIWLMFQPAASQGLNVSQVLSSDQYHENVLHKAQLH